MSKNSCLSFVRRHISNMKDGQIFTTRECLIYGKRSNVDNALSKCVRGGIIVRLTNGVFTRFTSDLQLPSFVEIATIKAKAFGKELLTHGADTAAKYGMITKGNDEPTFYVDGSSSCFLYRGSYIHLKKASKKRMHLPDDKAGLAIRALWHMGKEKMFRHIIDKVAILWNMRAERDKIYRGKAWMPAWLGDHFLTEKYVGPFGPSKPFPSEVYSGLHEFRDYMKYREENYITIMDPPGLDGNYCVVEFDQEPLENNQS